MATKTPAKEKLKAPQKGTPKHTSPPSSRLLYLVMALITVVFLVGGLFLYHRREQLFRQSIEDGLSVVAQLKAEQIVQWRAERLADADILVGNSFFTEGVERYMVSSKDLEAKDKVITGLAIVGKSYPYQDILLTDVNGSVLLSLNDSVHRLSDVTLAQVAIAIKEHTAVITDFHYPPDGNSPRIDAIAPIFTWGQDSPQAIGAVVLCIDPSKYLYPLLQSWPVPSETAETLLVERDGDQVLFLNELRHQKDTALKLSIPLSQQEVTAAMVVMGKEGVVEGKDYRGVKVLATLKHIPDSPWYMVAKIDVSEALAAWRFSASIIMAFVALLLAAALAGTGLIWQRRQRLAYQALYQAEETLRQSEEKYRTILREIADSYFEVDLAGNLTFVNDAACRNLRYSRKELLGMNYRGFAAEESIEHVYQAFNTVYRTGEPNKGFLWKLIRKDGSIGFADTSASLLRSQTGEIIGFRGVGRDVTERKMAEEERKQLELKAQIASRLASVGEMAAGVAHEINNPLTGVIGYAQYLVEREDIPPDIRSELAAINDGARRVAGIVQRLLAFSRQTEPERKLVDINELIESTLVLRAYHLRVNNIEVVTRLAPDLLETVADPGQIQQVLLNLIVNAEKEMKLAHGKGKLTMTTEKSDNTIKICCQDDGPGIKPEVMDRIFDPFFTTSEVGQGTGLGLSLCYGIVAEHKGKIYAESKPGKGATFIMELPVVTANEQPKPAEPVVKKSRKAVKARILVVDDEQVVRDVVNRVLIGEGHMPEGKQKLEKGTANEEMKHRATALTNSTTLDQSSDAVTSKLAEKAEKRPPSKQRVAG